LRVIAGEAHGRRLTAPRGLNTRPATARIRASIFSRIAARREIEGARVLDIFAGRGALGLEALSRGAASAVFVEAASAAAQVIERNLGDLGFADRGRLRKSDVIRACQQLSMQQARFDLVMIDPPFEQGYGEPVLAALAEENLVKPGGWVVLEVSRREPMPPAPSGLERVNMATVGDAQIALFRRPPAPAD
jgi:16S rRNA (guanine(966)-N(2))-methyltransferase RsmD